MGFSFEMKALELDSNISGRLLKLVHHGAKSRVEASLLGGSELGRNVEVGQAEQGFADMLETLLECGGVG
jgi:hypothetical protein